MRPELIPDARPGGRCPGSTGVVAGHGSGTRRLSFDHGSCLRRRCHTATGPGLGVFAGGPPRSSRLFPRNYNKLLYRRRNEIERLFRRLKGFRRVFSRFDKLDLMFTNFILFALIVEALR